MAKEKQLKYEFYELSRGEKTPNGVTVTFLYEKLLNAALKDPNVYVYVIKDSERIVATGTLCVKHTLEFAIADIESVVVSSQCRGKGYGKALMQHMIDVAKSRGIHHIQLTSNPKRVEANKLYQKMGFEKYETNCYKMVL